MLKIIPVCSMARQSEMIARIKEALPTDCEIDDREDVAISKKIREHTEDGHLVTVIGDIELMNNTFAVRVTKK